MDNIEENEDEVITGSSKSFNYDNCIFITQDSDESSNSMDLDQPSQGTLLEEDNSDDGNSSFNAKEIFVLMLGLLNKFEKYFSNKKKLVYKKDLHEEVILIKETLMQNTKYFGYDSVKSISGTLYLSEEKSLNKEQQTEENLANQTTQDASHLKDQVDKPNYEINNEMENQKKVTSSRKPQKSKKNAKTPRGLLKSTSNKKKLNNKMVTSTPNLESNIKHGQKRKKASSENKESTVTNSSPTKKRKLFVSYTIQDLQMAARKHSRSTGEPYDTVLYKMKEEMGLNPVSPRIRGSSESPRTSQNESISQNNTTVKQKLKKSNKTTSKASISPNTSKSQKNTSKTNKKLSVNKKSGKSKKSRSKPSLSLIETKPKKSLKKNLSWDEKLISNSRANMSRSSAKRPLYSADKWLDNLSSVSTTWDTM